MTTFSRPLTNSSSFLWDRGLPPEEVRVPNSLNFTKYFLTANMKLLNAFSASFIAALIIALQTASGLRLRKTTKLTEKSNA